MTCMVALSEADALMLRCQRIVRDTLSVSRLIPIDRDTDLKLNLGADSLDLMSIAMAVEEEFGIQVPDDAEARWRLFGDLVNFVGDALLMKEMMR